MKYIIGILFVLVLTNGFSQDELFNTNDIQFSPCYLDSNQAILFQSNRDKGFQLYQSTFENGKWSTPKALNTINSNFEPYKMITGPSVDAQKNVYFSSYNKDNESIDLYMSTYQDGKWNKPVPLPKSFNTVHHESFPSISTDGNFLIFNRQFTGDSLSSCKKMYLSKKTNDTWSTPTLLSLGTLNCPTLPTIQADNKTLYFNSEEKLYKSKLENDTWSTPEEITFIEGTKKISNVIINDDKGIAIYNEGGTLKSTKVPYEHRLTPFYVLDGQLKDALNNKAIQGTIFLTEVATKKSIPITCDKNGYFNVSVPCSTEYQLSILKEQYEPYVEKLSGSCTSYEYDKRDVLLQPKMKQYEINVADLETGDGISVDIKIDNLDLDEKITLNALIGVDGKYMVNLREGNQYNVEVQSREGYSFSKKKIKVAKSKDDTPLAKIINESESMKTSKELDDLLGELFANVDFDEDGHMTKAEEENKNAVAVDIDVQPLHQGAHVALNDIYFESSSYTMKEESKAELTRVIELMKTNPTLIIEIAAHTDNIGRDAFNLELSKKRAQTIFDYLKSQNVDITRLRPKGYGKAKPVASNTTEEGRAKNRRVELVIIK